MIDDKVKLIWVTPEAENKIMHCARVSSNSPDSKDTKLLKYCIKHGHWSIFEMANICLEINTSRAISAQIIRHSSFSFQEFSQRYAKVQGFETYSARRQDDTNRQNSIDDMANEDEMWFRVAQQNLHQKSADLYQQALDKGIAKEQARFLLLVSASTKLYMSGTIRSWMHYLQVRCGKETQLEHREIAEECKKIFKQELPVIAKALDW